MFPVKVTWKVEEGVNVERKRGEYHASNVYSLIDVVNLKVIRIFETARTDRSSAKPGSRQKSQNYNLGLMGKMEKFFSTID